MSGTVLQSDTYDHGHPEADTRPGVGFPKKPKDVSHRDVKERSVDLGMGWCVF